MRHKYVIVAFSILVLACSTTKTNTSFKNNSSLENQPIVTCEELPNVIDKEIELDILDNLNNLTFSQAYQRIHTRFDSISEHNFRIENQEFIKAVILEEFDNLKTVPSENLAKMDYAKQMKLTGDIKWYSRKKSSIEQLTVKGQGTKQLYIEMVTYFMGDTKNPSWKNKIALFVFDTTFDSLLYLNEFEYYCDPRDSIALEKVIKYGLERLKNDSTE